MCENSCGTLGSVAGVEAVTMLEVLAELVVSPLVLLLVELLDFVLALPGDLTAGGERSTSELISTMAVAAGSSASAYTVASESKRR